MADFMLFNTPVGLAKDEALAKVVEMLADVPAGQQSFAERYDNPSLTIHGSPASLVQVARDDRQIKDPHGTDILVSGLVLVVADLQRQIEALKAEATAKPKASTKR